MIHLKEFIVENIVHIFEGSSMGQKPDYNWRHNGLYDYAKGVISILVNSEECPYPTTLKRRPANITTDDEQNIININNEQREKLKELYKDIEHSSYSQFDDILKGITTWSKLDKYPFSTGSKSQSQSEAAEYLVSYLFNLGKDKIKELYDIIKSYKTFKDVPQSLDEIISDKNIKKGIKEWEEKTKTDSIRISTSPYLISSIKSAYLAYDLLDKLTLDPNEYIAIQTNRKILNEDNINKSKNIKQNAELVAKYLSEKNTIETLLNVITHKKIQCDSLFNFG